MTSLAQEPVAADRAPVAKDTRAWDRAAVAVPATVAAVLCFVQIAGRSLGFDEAATVTIASQHGSALGSAIAHDGGNMSGYYLLLHFLIAAFGNGLLVIRFPSAVASIASVALIGLIGLRLFNRRAAFAAGLLSAVSLSVVFWAQNARGYAPMVAFVCAGFLAFISLARPAEELPAAGAPPAQGSERRHWIAYVLFMTLGVYSSFVAVLVVPAQLLLLVRRRGLALRFVLALGAVAGLCLPLALLALNRGSSQLFWVPRPTQEIETQVLQSLTSAGLEPSFHNTLTTTTLLVATIALVLGVVALIGWRARRAAGGQWGGITILAWLLVPVLIAWLASYVIQPVFVPRNLLMCVPPGALLLGLGFSDPRLPRALALAGLIALVVLRALQVAASYGVSPEPWGQSTSYVLARARPGDCVAFYPADSRMAFQYYVGSRPAVVGRVPRSILPIGRWGEVIPFVEDYTTLSPGQIAARGAGCRRLWLVSSHEGELNGPAQSRTNRARFRQLRARLERVFGRAKAKQFGYASAVHVELLPGAGRVFAVARVSAAGRRRRRRR